MDLAAVCGYFTYLVDEWLQISISSIYSLDYPRKLPKLHYRRVRALTCAIPTLHQRFPYFIKLFIFFVFSPYRWDGK